MDHALTMGGFERLGNLLRNIECILNGNGPLLQMAPERLALDVFHDKKPSAA